MQLSRATHTPSQLGSDGLTRCRKLGGLQKTDIFSLTVLDAKGLKLKCGLIGSFWRL